MNRIKECNEVAMESPGATVQQLTETQLQETLNCAASKPRICELQAIQRTRLLHTH